MRRTPEATALSLTILSRPISPVRRDMGAAAQLDGISVAGALALGVDAHADDAHLIAIFLAEQRQRAFGDGLVGRHEMGLDRRVLHDHGVDQILDPPDLVMGHRLLVREIESEPPGLDQRALLRHMGPEHLAQRLMQEMGRGVMRAGRRAARMVDLEQRPRRRLSARPVSTTPSCRNSPCSFFCVSPTANFAPLAPESVPRSPTWPPDSA